MSEFPISDEAVEALEAELDVTFGLNIDGVREGIQAFLTAEGFEVRQRREGRIPHSDTAPRPPVQRRLVSPWKPVSGGGDE